MKDKSSLQLHVQKIQSESKSLNCTMTLAKLCVNRLFEVCGNLNMPHLLLDETSRSIASAELTFLLIPLIQSQFHHIRGHKNQCWDLFFF